MSTRQEIEQLKATFAENAAYTGPAGVIVVITPVDGSAYLHDGVTPGGWPIGSVIGGGGVVRSVVASGTSNTLSTLTGLQTAVIWRSATGGAKTQAIPAAASYPGYLLIVKVTPAVTGTLTITPASGTIDGAASYDIAAPDSLTLIADGANTDWIVT